MIENRKNKGGEEETTQKTKTGLRIEGLLKRGKREKRQSLVGGGQPLYVEANNDGPHGCGLPLPGQAIPPTEFPSRVGQL